MVDISFGEVPIQSLWTAFGRRAAVAVGALTAFTSLLTDSPVGVASMRGAFGWLAVAILFRVTTWLLDRTQVAPAEGAEGEEGADSSNSMETIQ